MPVTSWPKERSLNVLDPIRQFLQPISVAGLQELGDLPRFFAGQICAKPHMMRDRLPLGIAETLRRPDVVAAGTILGPELRSGLLWNSSRGLGVTDTGSLCVIAAADHCNQAYGSQ